MKAFITGGFGFVGRHLCKALSAAGHTLVVLRRDKSHPPFNLPMTVVDGDIKDLALIERVLAEYEIDTIFHLAAQTQVSTAIVNPLTTFETNIMGTWNVLEAARRQKVGRVIFASSDKCYGRSPPPYDENTVMATDRPYESSKACADILAHTYESTYGMSIATTRCVNLYGPGHLNFSTLMAGTIRRLINGERPIVKGNNMARDWLYVDDVIDAYLALAESKTTGYFCFGTGKATSVLDVVNKLITIMGSDLTPSCEIDRIGEIESQWSTYARAEKELGWKPKHSLDDGLKKTVEWYRNYLKD
jgi:CDP-glucose 4,6-dehydratase